MNNDLIKKYLHIENINGLRKISFDWEQFGQIANYLLNEVKNDGIEAIVGNARGGLPLAVYLAHHLGIGTKDFGVYKVQRHFGDEVKDKLIEKPYIDGSILPDVENRNVLIVEDTISTEMASINVIIEDLKKKKAKNISAVGMFVGERTDWPIKVSYFYLNKISDGDKQWVFFPWEVSNG